jgi:cell division protein FtsL
MRASESGQSRLKTLLVLAMLGALIYVAVQTVPVYVNNYELKDYIGQLAIQASAARTPAGQIQQSVLTRASDLNLPVSADQIKVESNQGNVKIEIDYTVPVDLRVYTLMLHFTVSTSNRALL